MLRNIVNRRRFASKKVVARTSKHETAFVSRRIVTRARIVDKRVNLVLGQGMRTKSPTKPGELIRDARLELGLSLRQIQEQTKIAFTALSMFETGKRAIPRHHLRPLGDALKLSLEDRAELRRLWDLDMDAREGAKLRS